MKNTHSLLSLLTLGSTLLPACSDGGAEDQASGTIEVQISGEDAATDGFLFPTGSEVTLADGWQLEFRHVLVTVGNITLSEDPDRAPSDQSQTGAVVAREAGPWAVDLHREGSASGAGGEGKAVPLFGFSNQNENGNEPLAADQRYAFGYEIVAASHDAERVNFEGDDAAEAAYARMIRQGHSLMYVGTATFKGEDCDTSDPGYDSSAIPESIDFELGFTAPTSYINCQNQENQGEPFADEEYQRGIAVTANAAAVAQITLHLEHAFYSDVQHEPALYFGQMAAGLAGQPRSTVLTADTLDGLDPSAFTDGEGNALPWRICDGSSLPSTPQMAFDTGSVPLNPAGDPSNALRDYRDYVHYVLSTLGHLNGGEGLCFAERNYPSPP